MLGEDREQYPPPSGLEEVQILYKKAKKQMKLVLDIVTKPKCLLQLSNKGKPGPNGGKMLKISHLVPGLMSSCKSGISGISERG